MRGLDPAVGKRKSSPGRLGLHTHTASTQQLSRLWGSMVCRSTKLERSCPGPDATGSQQAGKPLRQGGEGKDSMGTSDSKPASAFAELCNNKKKTAFKYFIKEEIMLDLPL